MSFCSEKRCNRQEDFKEILADCHDIENQSAMSWYSEDNDKRRFTSRTEFSFSLCRKNMNFSKHYDKDTRCFKDPLL